MSTWDRHLEEARGGLRRDIQAAALRLVDERGMPHVTMSAVAEEAGVSRQTLYNHYKDLEEIMLDIARTHIGVAAGMISEATAAESDARSALVAYVRGTLLSPAGGQGFTGLTGMSADAEAEIMQMLEPVHLQLRELLERGVRDGSFRSELEAEDVSEVVFHMIGSGRRLIQMGRHPDHVAETITELILRAIAA